MSYKLRHLQERLRWMATHARAVLVTGARQTGKSTLLKNLYPELSIVEFDRNIDLYGANNDPDLFLAGHTLPLILDEIQYAPNVLSAIKRHIDRSDKKGQFFLTGSHNIGLIKAATESMTGRVFIFELEHMSLFEAYGSVSFTNAHQNPPSWLEVYLATPHEVPAHFASLAPITSPAEVVFRGGFPEVCMAPLPVVSQYFKGYLSTYIERDALFADHRCASPLFNAFMRSLAALSGQVVNHELWCKKLELKKSDILSWEHALRQTYQWRLIPFYSNNSLKKVVSHRKGYMTDTGLACHLLNIFDPLALLNHPQKGALFETYCVNLVFQLLQGIYEQPALYHWHSIEGDEVDIILEKNGKLYPIEIKFSTNVTKDDTRGITALRKAFGEKVAHGIVLYAGKSCHYITPDVTALPFHALMKPRTHTSE